MSGPFPDPHHSVESNTIFGFWVYLMTDAILFATLFATYAVLHNSTFGGPGANILLRPSYALIETIILLSSSLTCGLAMTAVPFGNQKKLIRLYGTTFFLGACFLAMVGNEFMQLIASGNGWQRNAFTASYFTLVGTHAVHILFGMLFTLILMVQTVKWGLIPITIRRLECLKLFWFFSYWIWIFMFAIVYLIGVVK
ncbi:MAG TPA: cytochrome c oxidase subunit 3 [Chlamydiales bacterium]|nr:cytochrome c oxidase subunit 3 [Chlamydiales bacterium]